MRVDIPQLGKFKEEFENINGEQLFKRKINFNRLREEIHEKWPVILKDDIIVINSENFEINHCFSIKERECCVILNPTLNRAFFKIFQNGLEIKNNVENSEIYCGKNSSTELLSNAKVN